jgi:hypothetical protein
MFEIQHASPRVGSVIRTTKEDMVKGTYAAEIRWSGTIVPGIDRC